MATGYVAGEARPAGRLFYGAMGLLIAAIVFAGFARTYYLSHWLTPPARTPAITPLLHLHALVFTAWILLQAAQPVLVARGRTRLHRALGYGGAGLAFAVWLLGNFAAVEAIEAGYKGVGDPYAFYAITFFSIQAFGIIVALGIARRRDAEAHKRLMLLSSAAILEAAAGCRSTWSRRRRRFPSISAPTSSSPPASSTIGRYAAGSMRCGRGAAACWWRARCCGWRSWIPGRGWPSPGRWRRLAERAGPR